MGQAILLIIATFIAVASAAVLPGSNPNRCPQPSNPAYPVTNHFLYGHPDTCKSFYTCAHGNPILQHCPPGTVFSETYRTCVHPLSHFDTCTRENAVRECSQGATGLIPHPTACQRYYNCSDTTPRGPDTLFEPFEAECSHPDLFDATEKKCKPFKQVTCEYPRKESKNACGYYHNRCLPTQSRDECELCDIRFPSCVGRPDGPNENPYLLWNVQYLECDTERLVGQPVCGAHPLTNTQLFFSPLEKKCVTIWEVPRFVPYGLQPSCLPGSSGRFSIIGLTQGYYLCPGAEVFFCQSGYVFNDSSKQCVVAK